jgi:ATP-dependent DNA helicase RecG
VVPSPPGTPLEAIARIDLRRKKALEKLGVATVEDLLEHYPRRHEDRRTYLPIAALRTGVAVTVAGSIARIRERRTRRGWSMVEAEIADSSGILSAVWFHQPYLMDLLRPGARIFLYGEVKVPPPGRRGGGIRRSLQMIAPEFELDAAEADEESVGGGDVSLHLGRLVPIYPTSKGITQRYLRRLVDAAFSSGIAARSRDTVYRALEPQAMPRAEALRDLHFPPDDEALRRARDRLAREEYFLFATQVLRRREEFREGGGPAFDITPELEKKIRTVFPFQLTPDQDRAVAEICADLHGPAPMYRLLQGDVGTGKTAVALFALLAAVRNRYQGALMAPTEVLAEQHHRTISQYLSRHPKVRIALLTGSLSPAEKRRVQEGLARGSYHLAIGTHALIQEAVRFHNLGLVVIDEQHRFGVRERAALRKKGSHPHLLVMTATPIPRSLCLTAYGDLDLSLLERRPPGRRPVKTILVTTRQRPRAMQFIRGEIEKGRQAYFIYPLIDESEALVVPAAVEAHRRLSSEVFPGISIGLLHGRMPPKEKEERLRRFRDGLDQVLVATVVVEVGIDVPNATVLFLEDSSRFGLAQLHQLRGRIGRGSHQSYCLVSASGGGRGVHERLRAFAATEDGFRIAEEDLRLRGPGDFLGVRQTGWPDFVLGNPLRDQARFLSIRDQARRFWADPRNRARFPDWGRGDGASGEFLGLD